MSDVADIAGKLTAAQRGDLFRFANTFSFERYADHRTLAALDRKGLTGRYMRSSDFEMMVTVTSLGEQVRTYLESRR